MKKIVVAFLSLLLTSSLWAQKSTFGILAGAQATSAKYVIRGNEQKTGYKYGPLGVLIIKIPFENHLEFTPSFYYNRKGYTVVLKDTAAPPGIDAIGNDVALNTIDIAPLFNITMSKNPSHCFFQFGPVFDAVINGREKVTLNDGTTVDRPMKFSFADYGRITVSLTGRFGYEAASGFFVATQYSYGLGSLNNADFGPSIKHRIFGLMIGKFFNRNPNVVNTSVKE
jgi:hypothetical protein